MQRVERSFRPGQAARARLTVINDGNVPARYAVEVSPGVTAPVVGFVAEDTAVLLTDVVQPGRSTTVRVPLSLPQDIAEGRKVVRVRIGEPGPTGDLANVLDEQFFSGLLRVESPRPPAPPTPQAAPEPPPIEAMPLPGEAPPLQGRIVSAESPQRGQELRGGQRATVRVTYENTGREPHAFSIIAWAGQVTGPGQVNPDAQGTARGPALAPRSRGALDVSLELPQQPPLGIGPKDVLVMLVDLDPTGRFPVAIYDSRGLPNLFTLSAPVMPAPEVPRPPAPAAPRGLLPGNLDLLDPVATPATARPGEAVQLDLPFLNTGLISPPIIADVFILGPEETAVASLPRLTFSPETGLATLRTVRWVVPQAAEPGTYGVQVFAWDPNTFLAGDPSTYLIREQVLDVFNVEPLPTEAPLPEIVQPPGVMAPPGPPLPSPGDLGQPTVQFSPSTVQVGQRTRAAVSIPNMADFSFPALVDVDLNDPSGGLARTLIRGQQLTFRPMEPGSLGVDLDTAGLAPGSYGVRLLARDPSGQLLLARDLPGVLTIAIPAALRGLNEFRDVKFLYDGVVEPPDVGLLARLILRQPRAPRIPKMEGAPTGGAMLAVHIGEGGRFNVGYGIAQGVTGLRGVFPKPRHNDPHIFIRTTEEIPPHAVPTPIAVFIEGRGWPNEAVFPRGHTYDALKFIDNQATGETVYQNWDDDVFEVPG